MNRAGDISFARACILISVSNTDEGVRGGKNCGSNLCMNGHQGVSAAGEAHRRVGEDGRVAAAEALPGKEHDGMGTSLFAPQNSLIFCRSS